MNLNGKLKKICLKWKGGKEKKEKRKKRRRKKVEEYDWWNSHTQAANIHENTSRDSFDVLRGEKKENKKEAFSLTGCRC